MLLIAQHFVKDFGSRFGKPIQGISDAAAKKFLVYDWPGNVHKLRNTIERAGRPHPVQKISPSKTCRKKSQNYPGSQLFIAGNDPADLLPLEGMKRRYILHVLKTLGGNRTLASRVLEVTADSLTANSRALESCPDSLGALADHVATASQ